MKKSNESLYRHFRIVSVKKIDRSFFEKHDSRRTHSKIYETVVLPMFGICENTFLDYRNASDELLDLYPQPAYIEFLLRFPSMLVRYMPPGEANKFSRWLGDQVEYAFVAVLDRVPGGRVNAEMLITCFILYIQNKMPLGVK